MLNGIMWAATLTLLVALPGALSKSSKLVQISVSAPWGPAPLVMEAAEFWEDETFWGYCELVPVGATKGTDKEQHEMAVESAGKVTSPAQIDLLNFALALRNGSPKLETQREMWSAAQAAGCEIDLPEGAVVLVGGKCVSDVGVLRETVEMCSRTGHVQLTVHDADHVHFSSPDEASGVSTGE